MIDLDRPQWMHLRMRETEQIMIGDGRKPSDSEFGAFAMPLGVFTFAVIASVGEGWDHVSVSVAGQKRCPTWEEMDQIKRLFFRPHEVVMQIHPAEIDHVSIHPYVLHLWRPHHAKIPLPPKVMI